MSDANARIRLEALSARREEAAQFDARDSDYVERELFKLQAAAHRLLEFIERIERDAN
jgi:hypothetical protein